jgi:hypothetical protein
VDKAHANHQQQNPCCKNLFHSKIEVEFMFERLGQVRLPNNACKAWGKCIVNFGGTILQSFCER